MFDLREQLLLISAIKERPVLYNVRMNKNLSHERYKLWKEIAEIMQLDVTICKTRWKNMRDRYLKVKKELKVSESIGIIDKKPWPLFKYLTFLEDVINRDTVYLSNISVTASCSSETQHSMNNDLNEETPRCDTSSLKLRMSEAEQSPSEDSTPPGEVSHSSPYCQDNAEPSLEDPINYCTSSLNCKPSRKRKNNDNIKTMIVRHCLRNTALLQKLDNESTYDEDRHFVLSLLGPMKKLDEENKMDFKSEVYNLLKNKQRK